MAASPYQLTVVQCPRKFAFTYGNEHAKPEDQPAATLGKAIHHILDYYTWFGSIIEPESPAGKRAVLAVPYVAAGSLSEVKLKSRWQHADGSWHKLAVRIDNLLVPPAGSSGPAAIATDWKTGSKQCKEHINLATDLQAQMTAQVVGSTYGWPVLLRWVYLCKVSGKAEVDELLVYDNVETLRQLQVSNGITFDESLLRAQDMWQLVGQFPAAEFPINGLACEQRGHYCDYYGHCRMRRTMATVAELKAAHAARKTGNQAVNPPEMPLEPNNSPAESPTAILRAEAEAARAAAEAAAPPAAELKKRGRPRKAPPADGAMAAPALEGYSPEALKSGQAAPEVRSVWTLGDLQRLADELGSHGISVSFSFKG